MYQKEENGTDDRTTQYPHSDRPSRSDRGVIDCIGTLYATGNYSYGTLADEMYRRDATALDWRTQERRRFGRETMRGIVHNKASIGIVTCDGNEFPGQHPPI